MNSSASSERCDWVEILEPNCQERMYMNLVSGECRWQPPSEASVKRMDKERWWELFDPKMNRFYYHNSQTQQTVWEKPQCAEIIPLAKLQEAQMAHSTTPRRPRSRDGPPTMSTSRRRSQSRESGGADNGTGQPSNSPRRRMTGKAFAGLFSGRSRSVAGNNNGSTCKLDMLTAASSNGAGQGFQRYGSQQSVGSASGTLPNRLRRPPHYNESALRAFEEQCTVSEASMDSGLPPDTASLDGSLEDPYLILQGPNNPLYAAAYQQHPWGYASAGYPYLTAGGGAMLAGRPVIQQQYARQRGIPRTNPTLRRGSENAPSSKGSLSSSIYGTQQRSRRNPSASGRSPVSSSSSFPVTANGPPLLGGSSAAIDDGNMTLNQSASSETDTTCESETGGAASTRKNGGGGEGSKETDGMVRTQSTASVSSCGTESTVSSCMPGSQSGMMLMGNVNDPMGSTMLLQSPVTHQSIYGPTHLYDSPPCTVSPYSTYLDEMSSATGFYNLRRPQSLMVVNNMQGSPQELNPQYQTAYAAPYLLHQPDAQLLQRPSILHQRPTSVPYSTPLPGWNLGLFRKDLPPAKLLCWSKDSLHKPMLQITDKSLKKECAEVFKLIQMYMGDRKTKMNSPDILQNLVQRGSGNFLIRDEVFMMICKQTTNNPDEASMCRGWELLCTCLTFFGPSPRFQPYLEGYILRHLSPPKEGEAPVPPLVLRYGQAAWQRVRQQIEGPVRRAYQPLTQAEVENAKYNHYRSQPALWTPKKSVLQPTMFGSSLEEVMALQEELYPDARLPWILVVLCEEILRLNGQHTEGIFRYNSDPTSTSTLRASCERWELPSTSGHANSPHVAATLLKQWLRELTPALIPDTLSPLCMEMGDRAEESTQMVSRLPNINRLVFTYLIRFLQVFAVEENSSISKMDAQSFSLVIAPNIFSSSPVGTSNHAVLENALPQSCFLKTLILHMDTSLVDGLR